MKKVPKIVIVGRANVGKSMLFNHLSRMVKSIAFDYEGVTRDFISDRIVWKDQQLELVDTGGIRTRASDSHIEKTVSQRAIEQVKNASVVLFVCDGVAGVLPEDEQIARMLHKLGNPVIVVINKIDRTAAKEELHEFKRLGFKHSVAVSAAHALGIAELMDEILVLVPKEAEPSPVAPKSEYTVIILGKPNVGKSSLMNILVQQERSIVADEPGTTREPLLESVNFESQDILIADTPGIRRKRTVDEPLEQLMVKSAFSALNKADIVLLMVDASAGELSDQELKLAFYAFEKGKALIIVFNKQDLVRERERETLASDVDYYRHLMNKVEHISISCATGKNIDRILPLVQKIWLRHAQSFSDSELTVLFKEELTARPLVHNKQFLQIFNARQVKNAPITIAMRVNHARWFGDSEIACLENIMRKNFQLKGVPVKFVIR